WVNADGTPGGTAPPDGLFTSPTGTVNFAAGQPDDPADFDNTVQTAYVPAIPGTVGVPFDPLDPASFHHKLPLTVYDALGNPHQIEQYFIKRPGAGAGDPPHWEVQYITTTRDTSGAQLTLNPSSALIEFNSRGEFVATNPADLSLELTLDNTVAPTVPLEIQLNYAGSTQFGGEFSYAFDQDGYSTGEYSSMSVGPNGEIIAAYTNGEVQQMGYLVLANFNNLQGLQPVGGNAWRETSESGQPILGAPGTNGMSLIKGQSLEESNVDMGTELVNMIITQRTYQANAQTITTQSEVLQTLLNIR
ncbi:MAG: flagellar hook-basal body complex protein, partial [Burkholderiaceae bacterium]